MLIGSAICAGSPTDCFPLFLFGRALQGVAAAGINILTKVVLADKVSLKENAKNNSVFALVGGLSYGFGPAIGGALTGVSWRWCFIINLPIALMGMVVTFWLLRFELLGPQKIPGVDDAGSPLENSTSFRIRLGARLATIDYGGQLLFLIGMGLIILALTWAGSSYGWSDAQVLAPLIIGVVTFAGFVIWEYLMVPGRFLALRYPRKKAMVPFKLMWSRNSGLLCYINFITGMGEYFYRLIPYTIRG
jgi:MFS family permease